MVRRPPTDGSDHPTLGDGASIPMATSHRSRIFANGDATTLYLTIPARIVSDSQFPFDADADVTVSIQDGQLIVSDAGGSPD